MRLKDSLQFAHVVVKTLNLVISRCSFDECGRETFKNACHTCSTSTLVLLTNCNITGFWRFRSRSRRRFLNSLLSDLRWRRVRNLAFVCLRCPYQPQIYDFTSLLCRAPQKYELNACRTCSTIVFPLFTNHITALWRFRRGRRRRSLKSLKKQLMRNQL